MAQNPLGPPPPVKQDSAFDRWMRLMYQRIIATGQIIWTQLILPTVVKNTFLAGPTTGADAQASFRAIVAADLGSGTADSTKFLRGDLSWQVPSGSSGATSNTISSTTTVNADTSYMVASYLTVSSDLTVSGNLMVTG